MDNEPIPPPLPFVATFKRKQQRSGGAWIWFFSLTAACVIAAVVFGVAVMGSSPLTTVASITSDTTAKNAVRTWLKENLNDPEFEEVKWRIGGLKRNGRRLVSVRYRSRNGFGAKVLERDAFWVKDGKVIDVVPDVVVNANAIPNEWWESER